MPGIASAERRRVGAAGLSGAVEIVVDRWGIPHIYAGSTHDVFFAQGWNAARERLWQLDLWRKRGFGRLAESFGPQFVAKDRAARLFLYRGDMEAEWTVYGADAKAWTEAFVEGLNAYVGQVRAGDAPLPVEFKLSGTQPDLWDASDVVRIRSHGISNNAEGESIRMRIASAGGLEADRVRRKLEPDHTLALPDGLDLTDVPADLLADYTLGTKEPEFAHSGAPSATSAAPREMADEAAAGGSNNWAIAGSRTATGRPILASDPHRVLVAPSIRYVVHLEAPGYKVMGAGELHLPGVTLGHNEACAFGITIFPADHADFYVYELNPENPRQYRYDGGWEDMRIVTERLAVKGEPPRDVELAFTRHGPVLKNQPEKNRAFALRTAWTHPGTSAYFGAARYQTAADWPTFRAALKHWGAAPMNFVYADVAGNIAWQPAGFIPRRKGWDGLAGAPGDGRYEWDGFIAQEEMPTLLNPERGWIQTANELNVPLDHPAIGLGIGYEWADPGRAERIAEVLDAGHAMTVADSAALQVDVVSHSALRGTALLKGLTSPDADVQRAIDLLTGWDGAETLESAPAAIAEVWLAKHLGRAIAKRVATPGAAAIINAATTPSQYAAVAYLLSPGDALGPDPAAARREILLESLAAALGELTERLGPDMAAWRWGDLHHAHFVPAAAAFGDAAMKAKLSHGPAPIPGSAFTVGNATYRMDDFATTNGASVRMVMDVGEWDNSLVINTPGQSGDPDSPHYSDLFPLWAKGEFVPMLWSRGAVEAAAEQVIELTPLEAMASLRITAAQAMVRYLTAQFVEIDGAEVPYFAGVWAIFGHGNVAGIGEALHGVRDTLPTFRAHNEQAMAHAAIAFAKASKRRRAMACTTSIGPGALNMVTAAAVAHVNRLPVLLVPGDVFASRAPDPVLQQVEDFADATVSANDCFRPVSRYFDRITRPEQLIGSLPRALAIMLDPATCGPATLAFCQDVQAEAADFPAAMFERRVWRVRHQPPDPREIDALAAALLTAKAPLIIAGGGVIYAGAEAALAAFAERAGVPVGETQGGKGALAWEHPLALGAIGVTGTSAANRAAAEADLVIGIGTRLSDFTTGSRALFERPGVRLAQINVAAFDAAKHGALAVVGDGGAALEALAARLGGWRAPDAWAKSAVDGVAAWNSDWASATAPPAGNALPSDAQVIGAAWRQSGDDAVLVCAAGGLPGELHELWRTKQPGGYHLEYGFSCMGYEIAGGLGVKMAEPARDVIVMLGDGSYLMLNSEIATSVMLGLKLTIVVLDNRGFGCINRLQAETGGAPFNNLLADTQHAALPEIDFAAHAASLGALSEKVDDIAGLEAAMRRAAAADRTYVIVIDTDPALSTAAGGAWWDVAVPEVSDRAAVAAARAAYVEKLEERARAS